MEWPAQGSQSQVQVVKLATMNAIWNSLKAQESDLAATMVSFSENAVPDVFWEGEFFRTGKLPACQLVPPFNKLHPTCGCRCG
tara:strand:- start:133 stop:381 length:249 start_codon:yes stop_codon:yes gene_type:complete